MPPLLADFTHARVCKPFCEKFLTLPDMLVLHSGKHLRNHTTKAAGDPMHNAQVSGGFVSTKRRSLFSHLIFV